jgi:hypothetical protein
MVRGSFLAAGMLGIAISCSAAAQSSSRPHWVETWGSAQMAPGPQDELPAGADLAVSMRFKSGPGRQTGHPGAHASSFVARGDRVLEARWPEAERVEHWYQLAGVLARGEPGHPELIAKAYDSGDGLHPSPAGFRAMADAVPLSRLTSCRYAVQAGSGR